MEYHFGAILTSDFRAMLKARRLVKVTWASSAPLSDVVPPRLPGPNTHSTPLHDQQDSKKAAQGFRAAAAVVADDIRRASSRLAELTRREIFCSIRSQPFHIF